MKNFSIFIISIIIFGGLQSASAQGNNPERRTCSDR